MNEREQSLNAEIRAGWARWCELSRNKVDVAIQIGKMLFDLAAVLNLDLTPARNAPDKPNWAPIKELAWQRWQIPATTANRFLTFAENAYVITTAREKDSKPDFGVVDAEKAIAAARGPQRQRKKPSDKPTEDKPTDNGQATAGAGLPPTEAEQADNGPNGDATEEERTEQRIMNLFAGKEVEIARYKAQHRKFVLTVPKGSTAVYVLMPEEGT